jgi:integrase
MRRSLLRSRSWPVTAAGRWRRIATTCAASSSGPPTMASPSSRRAVRTSSCSAPGWRTAASPRRPSTVGSPRSAASTGSLTSTAASARTPPSTSADPRSTRRTRGLDRSELGVFLFTGEQYDRDHAALAVLLGLNGLRVSEACATNIEDLGFERGHRTLRIVGKGNKPATVPLVPRTARTIDLAVAERGANPAAP